MNWYYALNGQQVGPVGEYDLQTLAQSGTINGTTLVWREGLADWQPLAAALPDYNASEAPVIQGVPVVPAQKDLYVQQMREGVTAGLPGTVEYAGFWIRVGAKIIDNIIVMVGLVILMSVIGGLLYASGFSFDTSGGPDEPPPAGFLILMGFYYLFGIFLPIVYSAILVSKNGRTWGKAAVGIKVINEDGSPVTTGKAWGRAFAELVSGLTCSIGYILAAFDSEKRSLHDHICSTRVIKQ